jgi:heme A synthase
VCITQTIHAARCEQQESYKERDTAWISKIAALTQEATGGQVAARAATPHALTSWPLSSSSGWWPRQQGHQGQQEQQQQARLQQAATQLYEEMKAELLARAHTTSA